MLPQTSGVPHNQLQPFSYSTVARFNFFSFAPCPEANALENRRGLPSVPLLKALSWKNNTHLFSKTADRAPALQPSLLWLYLLHTALAHLPDALPVVWEMFL